MAVKSYIQSGRLLNYKNDDANITLCCPQWCWNEDITSRIENNKPAAQTAMDPFKSLDVIYTDLFPEATLGDGVSVCTDSHRLFPHTKWWYPKFLEQAICQHLY